MATKHIVTCVECGKRFDANKGAYYDRDSRRYTCRDCIKRERKAIQATAKRRAADQRERQTGMRQSIGSMIAKIAAGALFIIVGADMDTTSEVLTSLVLGGALIAWALVPYIKAKKAEKQSAAEVKALSDLPKTCPHCGANTKGNVCEYCGSRLV